ncbi:MAG TPA: phenylalanine--tRNA ligase subunit beta [bacterium]
MKVTYNWLKSLTDFDFTPKELVNRLTMVGLEVDSMQPQGWNFDGVVVGEVVKKVRHQESDHLWICDVNIGKRKLSVVCGAPNVEVGQKVAVAPEGTALPGGKVIQRTQIRGVISEGMICSEAELGISTRGEGIMVLDEHIKFGTKLRDAIGDGDIVIDIDVTPNRPDCFGAIGIAREIAALAASRLKLAKIKIKEDTKPIKSLVQIKILNPEKCPRYTARFIGNVEIQASPRWLRQRLEAIGIRSINNVVDVTNYVMMETGQPLHAFDYDLLQARKIIVKKARNGDEFTTLDDKTHKLNSSCLMICDGKRPVAIGGIMGGLNSEVSATTKNVLLESAYFDPVNIRRTSKHLGISTESSRRFERGTDPNGVLYALDRAAQLIAEVSGGKIAKGFIDVYPKRIKPTKIKLRPQRIKQLLGVAVSSTATKSILTGLGFKITAKGAAALTVEVPTFRPDMTREADLIEEVARVFGFDNIPEDTTASIDQLTPANLHEQFSHRLRLQLTAAGLSEILTYTLLSKKQAALFCGGDPVTEVVNPISVDFSTLRPSLLPCLIDIIKWNVNRKNADLKLFEIGNVFASHGSKIVETKKIAGVITGARFNNSWKQKSLDCDVFDVKGIVEGMLRRNHVVDFRFEPGATAFSKNTTLNVEVAGQAIGIVGEMKQEILAEFDVEQPVFFFEVDYFKLHEKVNRWLLYSAIPKFPPVVRDLAILVRKTIDAGLVADDIKSNGGEFLRNLSLFDVFVGEQIATGQKSLAFTLTFFSPQRTLTEEEVDRQIQQIINSLSSNFSARLRS